MYQVLKIKVVDHIVEFSNHFYTCQPQWISNSFDGKIG